MVCNRDIPKAPNGTPDSQRFWRRVRGGQVDECWIWQGSTGKHGYGYFAARGQVTVYAHRFAYQDLRVEIPEGLHLDHLCRNPSCVNPWHLEPVTPLVNTRRGVGNAAKQTAPCGHPYSAVNSQGRRFCRPCRLEYMQAYNQRTRRGRSAA